MKDYKTYSELLEIENKKLVERIKKSESEHERLLTTVKKQLNQLIEFLEQKNKDHEELKDGKG